MDKGNLFHIVHRFTLLAPLRNGLCQKADRVGSVSVVLVLVGLVTFDLLLLGLVLSEHRLWYLQIFGVARENFLSVLNRF